MRENEREKGAAVSHEGGLASHEFPKRERQKSVFFHVCVWVWVWVCVCFAFTVNKVRTQNEK